MRVVRLKLRGVQFWELPPIRLYEQKEISPPINIDLLNDRQKEVINRSDRAQEIMIFDSENKRVQGGLDNVNIITGDYVCTDDIEEEPDIIPEVVSITIGNDNEEEEPLEEEFSIDNKFYEEAKILLARNGNTVKKSVLALEETDDNIMLLHACLEIESEEKQRAGVLSTIYSKISE